ncbi:hypothetical protein NDU88_003224 [Pleurodeles waltl]|uniref:Uncharacterized protein n=1 Tax=Pleurodeles waltl TaxID=8319 RepID=A0AAV7RHM0_PLEWA|nr:hypothetical protein NDU88_003224 [Pleurodeles waltl]
MQTENRRRERRIDDATECWRRRCGVLKQSCGAALRSIIRKRRIEELLLGGRAAAGGCEEDAGDHADRGPISTTNSKDAPRGENTDTSNPALPAPDIAWHQAVTGWSEVATPRSTQFKHSETTQQKGEVTEGVDRQLHPQGIGNPRNKKKGATKRKRKRIFAGTGARRVIEAGSPLPQSQERTEISTEQGDLRTSSELRVHPDLNFNPDAAPFSVPPGTGCMTSVGASNAYHAVTAFTLGTASARRYSGHCLEFIDIFPDVGLN